MDQMHTFFSGAEKVLNAAEWVPPLSPHAALMRLHMGELQVIGFAAKGAFHYLEGTLNQNPEKLTAARIALKNTSHGFANMGRALITGTIPFAGLGLAFAYDLKGHRFCYSHEKMSAHSSKITSI